ncbi:MinD/ParA family protein [Thalassobacillus hwangdonensis]|uniref:MinD/ParA family protein n=1 Tax=Thalassobacillus hwangdonensis TaxID=546108 RepID=A0ABW3KYP8_9BACI
MTDQAQRLREILEQRKQTGRARTIAITSGKGGVGKSNFALNFSMELINLGKRVLLFDLDIGMGNIDILIGKSPTYTILNLFDEKLSIHDIIESGPNSLSYIAGGSGFTDFFKLTDEKFRYFTQEFDKLQQTYDYIIFDMGAGATQDSLHFILAADEVIVVTTPEPTSLTDAYAMIKHVHRSRSDQSIRILINRAANKSEGHETIDRLTSVVRKFLDREIEALGILPDDKTVSKAVIQQVPYTQFDKRSSISKALVEVAGDFVSGTNTEEKRQESSFLFKLKELLQRGK